MNEQDKINNHDFNYLDQSLNFLRFKIVFVGDVSVGKTSIINAIMDKPFKDDYEPSVGVDFFTKTIKFKDKNIKLQVWDSAGQEKYRSLIPNYIRGSSLVFLVYDVTRKETFDSLSSWIKFINDYEKTSIVLIGNKIDKQKEIEVKETEAKLFASRNNIEFFQVSAKNNKGISNMLFKSLAELNYFTQYDNDIEKLAMEIEKDNAALNGDVTNSGLNPSFESEINHIDKVQNDDLLFDNLEKPNNKISIDKNNNADERNFSSDIGGLGNNKVNKNKDKKCIC